MITKEKLEELSKKIDKVLSKETNQTMKDYYNNLLRNRLDSGLITLEEYLKYKK